MTRPNEMGLNEELQLLHGKLADAVLLAFVDAGVPCTRGSTVHKCIIMRLAETLQNARESLHASPTVDEYMRAIGVQP